MDFPGHSGSLWRMSDGLQGQVVVVTGGTGNVGWGIARAASEDGARLVLVARSPASHDALRAEFPGALVVQADPTQPATLGALRRGVLDRVDHVIAPLGGWWSKGPSLEQPPEELRTLLATFVEAPLALLQALAPALRASRGSFTFITGAGGDGPYIPGAGLMAAAATAQQALSRVLREELASEPFRVNEIRIVARIEKRARPGVIAGEVAGSTFLSVLKGEARGRKFAYGRDGLLSG